MSDRENLYSLWDVYETIVNTDKEKAEVLNPFVSSLFNSKTGCHTQDKCSPELGDGDREQNRLLKSNRKQLGTC